MDIIKIKNLSFSYETKEIFNNINLNIANNKTTMLIGTNGSGKSTLINILLGLIPHQGTIYIDNILLNKENIYEIRKKIGYVNDKIEDLFLGVNVLDNLVYNLENLCYKDELIKENLDYIVNLFKLNNILDKESYNLSKSKKQLINIAASLIHKPNILIIDEGLNYLNKEDKETLSNAIKQYKNDHNLSILLVTHDTNITTLSDTIILLKDGSIIFKDNPSKLYNNKTLLEELNIEIPFIVKLSNALIEQKIINKIYLDKKELVNHLWK